tara:strand:+ start:278 stop:448 length:171 start_codon:yes stop_codon:yes gene_type:complete
MEFETTDIVEIFEVEELLRVTGVIHDDERIFVTGEDGIEREYPFSDVVQRWEYKAI